MFLLSLTPFAVFAAQDNAKEYIDMCAILKLLTQKISSTQTKYNAGKAVTSVTATSKMAATYGNIVRLNLKVVPDTILAILSDKAKYKDGKTVKADKVVKDVFIGIDEGTIDVMLAQAAKLAGETGDKDFAARYGLPISIATRDRVSSTVRALLNKARTLREKSSTVEQQTSTLEIQTRKLMLEALYWQAYLDRNDAATTADGEAPPLEAHEFSWTNSATRDDNCKTADGDADKAGHCIAQDIVCLCVNGHKSGNQYCTTAQTAADNYSDTTASKATSLGTFNKLAAACTTGGAGRDAELSGKNPCSGSNGAENKLRLQLGQSSCRRRCDNERGRQKRHPWCLHRRRHHKS
uniref:Variant surface glycoprotein 1125.1438 n=1 Tax=Trypanosoma brucei TaxID=5691 RepID=A0A1J0R4L1_9TRYP|nr:variant surface glycoprotein 1125.1438 [Trypanosoma brucei]